MTLRETIREDLEKHEGRVRHAYQDHLGYLTIGVGRLIDERRGGGLSDAEVDYLLNNDIDRVAIGMNRRLAWLRLAPENVQRAMLNMAFQMGIEGVMGFRKMLAALEAEDYETAASEALDSKWARQTPGRAREVAGWIRSAE